MFDLFAIPHSVEMNAKRTMVCVALCHKGVAWNGPTIKLALMIAVCAMMTAVNSLKCSTQS